MTPYRTIVLIIAVIVFLVAAAGGSIPRVNLVALGLALLAGSFLL